MIENNNKKLLKIAQIIFVALCAMMSIRLFYEGFMTLFMNAKDVNLGLSSDSNKRYMDITASIEIILAVLLFLISLLTVFKFNEKNDKRQALLSKIGIWSSFATSVLTLLFFVLSFLCLPIVGNKIIIIGSVDFALAATLQPLLITTFFIITAYFILSISIMNANLTKKCTIDEEVASDDATINGLALLKSTQLNMSEVATCDNNQVVSAANDDSSAKRRDNLQCKAKNNKLKMLGIVLVSLTVIFTIMFPFACLTMPSEPTHEIALFDKVVTNENKIEFELYIDSEIKYDFTMIFYFDVEGKEKTLTREFKFEDNYSKELVSIYKAHENEKAKAKKVTIKVNGKEKNIPTYSRKVSEFTGIGVISLLLFISSLAGSVAVGSIYIIKSLKQKI